MILAGDIGGTKTILALFDESGDDLIPVREATFPSREHRSLEEILTEFLSGGVRAALRAGCFGVAGPVVDGKCHTTNLPWNLEEHELARCIGAPRVRLLNDLEAAAYGMLFLKADEVCALNPARGTLRTGNVAVIAAGTGLGEAFLFWDGAHYHPVASEGGHADFAPRTEREIELLRYLRNRFGGHVSYERVLSGPGILNIYAFLRDSGLAPEAPALKARLTEEDPNHVISELGLTAADPLCAATLDMFVSIYGSEAGNLTLSCVGVGGVFVGGGIAPKILPALQNGSFMDRFADKGRFHDLLTSIEVRVALNPRTPLIGAAHFGRRLV